MKPRSLGHNEHTFSRDKHTSSSYCVPSKVTGHKEALSSSAGLSRDLVLTVSAFAPWSAINMYWTMIGWVGIVLAHLIFEVEEDSEIILLNPLLLYSHLVTASHDLRCLTPRGSTITFFSQLWKLLHSEVNSTAAVEWLWSSWRNLTDIPFQLSLPCLPPSTKWLS